MDWIEVCIHTNTEAIEAVSAMLFEVGITGVQIDDDIDLQNFLLNNDSQWDYVDESLLNKEYAETHITFYVSDNAYGNEILSAVRNEIQRFKSMNLEINLGSLELTLTNVNEEDWVNNWKKYYKPFEVGKKIVIKPLWEEYKEETDRIIFNSNPGSVFGTGLHQSTQLCISELESYVDQNTTLLDLGCGSGILSIIALLLGAKSAYAVDIDKNAVEIAYENASINNISKDKYFVCSGNVLTDLELQERLGYEKYDVVVANIVADIIIGLAYIVSRQLKQNGIFISSGIIKERFPEVIHALEENHFEVLGINYKDDWVCIVARLQSF